MTDGLSIPESGLTEHAVDLALTADRFFEMNEDDIDAMYDTMHRLVQLWKEKNISESYMLLGRESAHSFSLQAVPYRNMTNWFGKVWQQALVLWRFTFGGYQSTPQRKESLNATYKDLPDDVEAVAEQVDSVHNCAFCRESVIDSQVVLEGKTVRILYNYAPIAHPHFLVVTKEHRPDFAALTKEEHREAFELSQFVINRLQTCEGPPLQKLYFYHKTGVEAGESVPHFHLHIVLTPDYNWLEILTVLRNIVLGTLFSFQLSGKDLASQQGKYTAILASE